MKCQVRVLCLCIGALVTSTLIAADAAAQAPVHLFADLQSTLTIGQRVIVRGDDGRTTRGRVVSLVGDQLEIRRRRFLRFREERRVFAESSVQRIELNDSTWNGAVIGLAAGLATGILIDRQCDGTGCVYPFATILFSTLGLSTGGIVDGFMNRTIYESRQKSGVTFAPLIGPSGMGLAAHVHF